VFVGWETGPHAAVDAEAGAGEVGCWCRFIVRRGEGGEHEFGRGHGGEVGLEEGGPGRWFRDWGVCGRHGVEQGAESVDCGAGNIGGGGLVCFRVV
jgi:hypothetical protein